MTRQALASEALKLSRTVLASMPVQARVASIVRAFLRQAFSKDDLALMIGIEALIAMEKAGTPGKVGQSTIEELRPYIKRNNLSKLKGPAKTVGEQIYNTSMAGRGSNIPLTTVEEAWHAFVPMLERHPLAGDKNVGQAISYIANGFTQRLKNSIKSKSRQRELRQDPDFADTSLRDHERPADEAALWDQVEHKIKSNPHLLGPKGEPWAWIYIEGKAQGMSESEIMDACADASRKVGGEAFKSRSSFLKWINQPQRHNILRSLTKQYLEESVVKKLKLAAARGALDTAHLLPFEREILAFLASEDEEPEKAPIRILPAR